MKFTELKKDCWYNIESIGPKSKKWTGQAQYRGVINHTDYLEVAAEFECEDGISGAFTENEIISLFRENIKIKDLVVGGWYQLEYKDDNNCEHSYSGPAKYLGKSGSDYPENSIKFHLPGEEYSGHFGIEDVKSEIPRPESDKTAQDKFIEWILAESKEWSNQAPISDSDHERFYLGRQILQKIKELGLDK